MMNYIKQYTKIALFLLEFQPVTIYTELETQLIKT